LKRWARARAWDLPALLNAANPRASRAERHLWLVRLLEWLRHGDAVDAAGTPKPLLRLALLLKALDQQPAYRTAVRAMLLSIWREGDVAGLFADVGFTHRRELLGEAVARLRLRWLPITPDTDDLALLFHLLFVHGDAAWITRIDDDTLARLGDLLEAEPPPAAAAAAAAAAPAAGSGPRIDPWREPLWDAMRAVASQIHAAGLSSHLRQRMSPALLADRPFAQLPTALARVIDQIEHGEHAQALTASTYLRALLQRCHTAADSVHEHLEEHGISVNIVFEVDQLHARTRRLDALLECALSPSAARDVTRQLAHLIELTEERRSLGALFAQQFSLLARKVVERNAETGEHYITRSAREFRAMLRKAAGGGVVLAMTTFIKFGIAAIGLGAFWGGVWIGLNYAASFVVIHLLHFTVATKQPAMTAPAMAAQLEDVSDEAGLAEFIDEVANLVRSQIAGIAGNLALVTPVVLGVQMLSVWTFGRPLIGAETGEHVLQSLTLLGPTALYAAFTGVLLFASSLIAGWVENFFVYHRLDSALAWNPRILARLGSQRAQRWSTWWRGNISGMAANVSLGLMLGIVPVLVSFFVGLPMEVRHVTLSTGQLAAATVALGWPVLTTTAFWWCVAGIAATAVLNLSVSFGLAMRLAVRARGVALQGRRRIYGAIWRRFAAHPLSFLFPFRKMGSESIFREN
jgi:site-specific recombinase